MPTNIPIRLLAEAQQHVVTLELNSGQTYRGTLVRSEENMNVQLSDVVVTERDGQVSHMDLVYIRGSHVRMVILPDILKYSPLFRPDIAEQAQQQAKKPRSKAR